MPKGACPSKTPQSKEWSRRKLRRDLWGERLAPEGTLSSTRVSHLAKPGKRRRAALRWISRLYVITLITGIEIARESYSKPRERPLFSSPHLTCFALARARSGPNARDEVLTG